MSWFREPATGEIFADTDFLNRMQPRLKDCALKHRGFGEFTLETPKGSVDFIRTSFENIPGQSGRSHRVRGSVEAVALVLEAMKDDERRPGESPELRTRAREVGISDMIPVVACKTCGEPTTFKGTKRCNDCHEVEMRLEGYLRRGGANARGFVSTMLAGARVESFGYPTDWPKCPSCGQPTLDGKATCGRVECGTAAQAEAKGRGTR